MEIKFYGYDYVDEKSKPTHTFTDNFNVVKRSDKLIKNIVKGLGSDYKFSINGEMHDLSQYFVLKVNINLVGNIYFLLEQMEDKTPLVEKITPLKDLPISNWEEKKAKVKKLFKAVNKFKPILIVSETFIPFVEQKDILKSTFFLMKNDPKDPKEAEEKEKKDKLVDRLFSLIIPIFLVLFVYLIFNYFAKNSSLPAVLLVFGTLLALGILSYGLFWIYKEKRSYKDSKDYLNILYLLNLGGLVLGAGASFAVGKFVVKEGEFIKQTGKLINCEK